MKLAPVFLSAALITTVALGDTVEVYIPNAIISDVDLELSTNGQKRYTKFALLLLRVQDLKMKKKSNASQRKGFTAPLIVTSL